MTEPKVVLEAALRKLTWAVVGMYVILIAVGTFFYFELTDLATSTAITTTTQNQALCTLRADLQQRVDSSLKFLRHHPEGFAGIPPSTIKEGIENQQRTIKALSPLVCEESP